MDYAQMLKLNEELYRYPGNLNIRDNILLLAKVTDTQRISILARKKDENPIFKVVTNVQSLNNPEND